MLTKKLTLVRQITAADLPSGAALCIAEPEGLPGRPDRPELVPPLQVERRSMATSEGRAALLHALCHIEFNAVKNESNVDNAMCN